MEQQYFISILTDYEGDAFGCLVCRHCHSDFSTFRFAYVYICRHIGMSRSGCCGMVLTLMCYNDIFVQLSGVFSTNAGHLWAFIWVRILFITLLKYVKYVLNERLDHRLKTKINCRDYLYFIAIVRSIWQKLFQYISLECVPIYRNNKAIMSTCNLQPYLQQNGRNLHFYIKNKPMRPIKPALVDAALWLS